MKFITQKQYVEYLENKDSIENIYKNDEFLETNTEIYDEKLVQRIDKMHDKMFRNILSIKKEMVKFLKEFLDLKENIKIQNIVQCKTDFITKNYKNRQSDIIYKIKNRPIYFLVEHQSTVNENMLLRMWEYVGEIMRRECLIQDRNLDKKTVYPIVIPTVIYTGYQKWNIETNLLNKQYQSFDYDRYRFDFEYNLIAIQDYSFEELLEKKSLFGSIMVIEKCKTRKEIEAEINNIIEIIEEKTDIEILSEIIINIIEPIVGNKKAKELLEKLERKGENPMSPFTKTLLDLTIKSKREGRKEGMKQGMKQGIINTAKKMLQKNMKIKEIEEITGLTKEEILSIAKNQA